MFEKFISTDLKYYGLDTCHYFSAPGLSWGAMLKMTLEKINDPDKYMFFEQGMRGGVSYINEIYSKVNNKYCTDYHKEKPEKYILYLSMNNLYGCAMSQYLPYVNFKWVKNIDEIKQKLMNIKSNNSTGYILEVDLEYPEELHDIHNYYPLAPEKINILNKWLSDYSLEISNAHNITTGTVKKLVANLINKINYVVHYRNLQQCLELGMKFKKIHRILKFKEKDWMKTYIYFNTQKRKEVTNEVDKNHFKLLNNAVYDKTMENMRKSIKIRIVKNSQDFIKYTSRPACVNWKVFENSLAAIHEKKISLALNEPIFTVLELSKWEIYNFHYNFMIRKFNTKLLFTDTDSLCYQIYGKKSHKKMYRYKELIDLSNLPLSSEYYCSDNKNVLGKMKDEYGGKSILKFVGLTSKMYSLLDESNNEKIMSKGQTVL